MKRLRNTSGLPDSTVRQVVDWIAEDLGIAGFDVECRAGSSVIVGSAYSKGSSYHSTARPFVVLRIGTDSMTHYEQATRGTIYHGSRRAHLPDPQKGIKVSKLRFPATIAPYQYAHHKGKRYVVANRIEALVYLTAHELRHLWQAASASDKARSKSLPRFHGSRGKFSEIDTEAYAIHTLRRWRKAQLK
jgi:hypothetical protein